MTTFLAAIAAGLLWITSAQSAEIIRNDWMIVLKGFIEKGDNEKFAEITKGMPEAFVMLDSPGGDNRAAIVIGSLIIDNNYATGVRDGMTCNSACTLIWLAGKPRFLDYNSRLGFHSASPSKERRHERDEEGNIQIAFYMRMIGVPQQVIELQPKADPCCFNYVDYKQARAWGLLEGQKLAPGEIAAPSAPSGRQHTAASVTTNKVVKAARGDQLPKQMLGNWCAAPKKNRELYSRGSCTEDKGFQINKNNFISMESSCDFKTVKKLPNGSYFVRAECIDKDGLTNEEMVFQIEDGQLEIITTTIRFCVSVIEPPPNVARDPEYSEDKWLALREGPGTQFKIIVKLGSQEELLADDVKGEWTHVSNVTRLSSSDSNKPKIVQGWVRSKYIQRCKETESDEATSQQEPAKSGGAFGQSGPQLHMQEVFPLNPAIERKNSPILGAGAAFGRPTLAPPIVLDKEFMRTNLHKLGIFSTAKILFHMMAIDGDNVEVREYCGSGCTLVVAYIPKHKLCFGAGGHLGFHMGRVAPLGWKPGEPHPHFFPPDLETTKWMVDNYPDDIREWINARGGYSQLPMEGYLVLSAQTLWAMGYRRCAD